MNNQAIGIFDSGLGGLSVWMELMKVLPQESFIYYADRVNCPYGQKSSEEIIELSHRIVDFLIEKSCKMLVIACNTATSAAIDFLRRHYSIPFIGMEPAIKPAALHTKTGKIGVIATQSTLNGDLFRKTSEKFAKNVEVQVQIGYGLVEVVETNLYDTEKAEELLRRYVNPMLKNNTDQIVLGCTHYSFLIPQIQKIIKKQNITILNPALAVAKQTKNVLEKKALQNCSGISPRHSLYTNENAEGLEAFLKKIYPTIPENLSVFSL